MSAFLTISASTRCATSRIVRESWRFGARPQRCWGLVPAAIMALAVGLPNAASAASLLERTRFVMEPGVHYGASLGQKRFRESNIRYNLDTGFAFGIDANSRRAVGITLHSAFAGSDSRFAIRPRFTWGRSSALFYTLSAGYIFYTAEDATDVEDAEVSDSGFVGGGSVNLGDLALQLDVSIVDVGPSFGHEGGTEASVFGGVGYRGIPGVKISFFALGIVVILSAVYVASIS